MPLPDYIDGGDGGGRKRRPPAKRRRRLSPFGEWVARTSRLTLVLVVIALTLALIGCALMFSAYAMVRSNINRIVNIDLPQGSQATRIYARDYDPKTNRGTLLALIYDQNRTNVDYDELPPELIACLISTEDKNFYEHKGVDFLGTARAVVKGAARGGDIRGTSTLTQQLARNVFLPFIKSERTINRKIQEFILAGALEKEFTKPEILQAYLNHVYFGSHAYGAQAASQTYFSKSLNKLTLGEAAMLAGMPQAPSRYDPYKNPERTEVRRKQVLNLLKTRLNSNFFAKLRQHDPEKFKDFKLTAADIDKALAEDPVGKKLARQRKDRYMRAEYFVDWLNHKYLANKYGGEDNIKRQGLIVVTTIDPDIQKLADRKLRENIDKDRRSKDVSQGAVIVLEAKTGEVLACSGGYKWLEPNRKGPMAGKPDMYNRAMGKGRQTGSSFKPFNYATAYEQGFPPTLMLYDGPYEPEVKRTGKSWPKNSDGSMSRSAVPMYRALQKSMNTCAVDLQNNCVGTPAVIEMATRMGIERRRMPEVPALTLGIADIPPIDMAEAFDTFPNMGVHVDSVYIKKVYNQNGVLLENNDSAGGVAERSNRAFSHQTGWQMVKNMLLAVNAGTGQSARVSGVEIGGKTGTCDDYGDAWFVGYSPELVCAVWVGNDDFNDKMVRMFGGNTPARTFKDIMSGIYGKEGVARYKQTKFKQPDGTSWKPYGPAVGIPRGVGIGGAKKKVEKKEDAPADGGGGGDSNRWNPPNDAGDVFF